MVSILLGLHLPPFWGYLGARNGFAVPICARDRFEKERVSASVFRAVAALSRQIALVLRDWVQQSSNGPSAAEKEMVGVKPSLSGGNGTVVPYFGPTSM